ncbi:hypothetical protein [Dickeya poaceiphila]|uniref:Uncharacterized protein n=1 Tax=Dickeya poaceiphila TaxID=568768 RepID=A0A5B8HPT7_9GAMM|nr:hypothetical protein [Dickeya poaceiphila]QDX30616.1 hypothetical protein Dpoa569_0002528 [Dickeya poaceiphila]
MEIRSDTTTYFQVKNTSDNTQKVAQSALSQTDHQQGPLSNTQQATFSGKGLMMSRLFGDSSATPTVQTQLTETTMKMSSVNFLTYQDRDMLSALYANAQQSGVDLQYVDDLARDLGDYRMFGSVSVSVNNGKMYDMNGRAQTFHFTDTDAATATQILNSEGITTTTLDTGFLHYQLDPGFSFNHRTNFAFLAEVVNTFGQGATHAGEPLSSSFPAYQAQGNNNFVVKTATDSTLPPVEEPDFRSVDGIISITPTGAKNGFQWVNDKLVKSFSMTLLDLLTSEKNRTLTQL